MKQELSRRQTLEQLRAQESWRRVNQIKEESKERQKKSQGRDKASLEKEYRARVRSLNAMIQINGLGPTLGFLKAKSNGNEVKRGEDPNAPYLLLEHLTDWMSDRKFIRTDSKSGDDETSEANEAENSLQNTDGAKNATNKASEMSFEEHDGILNWIIGEASRDQYRRATTECLAFGLWLRRFAEAELEASSTQVLDANSQQTSENESSTSIPRMRV